MLWLALGMLAAFFVAWNNGSNNAANAIGTAVGSGAITLRKALIFSAIFDFLGAVIFGHFVSRTIMKGIVDVTAIPEAEVIIRGMIAALIATGIWVLISSWLKIPMSISEGIVGGVLGFGIAVGPHLIRWNTVIFIFTSWTLLPGFSAIVALILFKFYEKMFSEVKLLNIVGLTSMFIMVFSTVFLLMVKTAKIEDVLYVATISVLSGAIASLGFAIYLRYLKRRKSGSVRDDVIKFLLLVAAASMAFSHGANDVANSAGPLMAIIVATTQGGVPPVVKIDPLVLTFCAFGIAFGIVSWGSRVVETLGEDIVTLTYSSAFTAQLAASLSVLILTRLGMPVSTTISIVGAIAGVGLAKGIKAVNLRTLLKIFSAWIVAVPAVIGLSIASYFLLTFLTAT